MNSSSYTCHLLFIAIVAAIQMYCKQGSIYIGFLVWGRSVGGQGVQL